MPFKFLPAQDNWEKALASVKVKPDSALSKALDESFKVDSDQPAKRLAMLPKILKLAGDFKKSKVVVAAGPNAVKLVQELIDVVPVVRKDLEKNVKEFQKSGACEIDVQFLISDWNGKSFEYAEGYVAFEAPGLPTIRKSGKLSASGLSVNDVKLPPNGTVTLTIYPRVAEAIEGSTSYEFKPGQKLMQFKAVQHVKTHKTKAKTANEATQKFGLKGSVGVEFKFVSVGGEVTRDSEYKNAYEDEVEWEIEAGVPTFKSFTQTK
jgi:hypothetical protein